MCSSKAKIECDVNMTNSSSSRRRTRAADTRSRLHHRQQYIPVVYTTPTAAVVSARSINVLIVFSTYAMYRRVLSVSLSVELHEGRG